MYSCFSSTFQSPRTTCKVGKSCFKRMPFDQCLDELGHSTSVKTAAPCPQESRCRLATCSSHRPLHLLSPSPDRLETHRVRSGERLEDGQDLHCQRLETTLRRLKADTEQKQTQVLRCVLFLSEREVYQGVSPKLAGCLKGVFSQ